MPPLPKPYSLITTLGPASDREETWTGLLAAGATAFRLNTSHLSLEQLSAWLERLERFLPAHTSDFPLVLDLQGSKWRLGEFAPLDLSPGQKVNLVLADSTTRPDTLPVPHPDFFAAAQDCGGEIVLNDAKSRLTLESIGSDILHARTLLGGRVSPRKGITLNGCELRQESLNPKDKAILEQTRDLPLVQYAISYVKDAVEMSQYRQQFGPSARLIAKLERREAMNEALEISQHCEVLWVCRGDLGAEIGLAAMAESVHDLTIKIPGISKPVFMAGQVLEHMAFQPTPTRSEICYLYDALQDGYQGFVLSDETAVGPYPLEACQAAASFRG